MTSIAKMEGDRRQWQERFDNFLEKDDLIVSFTSSNGGIFLQRALPQNLIARGPHFAQLLAQPEGRDGIHARLFTHKPNANPTKSEPEIILYDVLLHNGTESVRAGNVSASSFDAVRQAWVNMRAEFNRLPGLKTIHNLEMQEWPEFNGALDAIFWKPVENHRLYSNITNATSLDMAKSYEFVERMLRLRMAQGNGVPESAPFFDPARYAKS